MHEGQWRNRRECNDWQAKNVKRTTKQMVIHTHTHKQTQKRKMDTDTTKDKRERERERERESVQLDQKSTTINDPEDLISYSYFRFTQLV